MKTRATVGLSMLIILFSSAFVALERDTVFAETAVTGHDVDLASAQRIIAAALKKAEALDTKMNITVLGVGGQLKAFARMDGAYLGSIDISAKKAKTARYFDMPSEVLGSLSQPGGPLYGIELSNDGLITFAGGIPLKNKNDEVIGAIGVSGSSVENDQAVAQAGADAL